MPLPDMYEWFARWLIVAGEKSASRLMNPEWKTIWEVRFWLFESSSASGSMIVGGANSPGDAEDLSPTDGLRLKGKAEREDDAEPPGVRSFSPSFLSEREMFSDEADPLRFGLGGTKPPSFGADNFDGNRGVNECERACTGPDAGVNGGEVVLTGEEAEVDFVGGEEVKLSEVVIVGNGKCFPPCRELEGEVDGECKLTLPKLSLRLPRYCSILPANVVSIGLITGLMLCAIFPRSSADFDQGLREIFRRSPRPPFESPGLEGEDGPRVDGKGWLWSNVVAVRARERSRTDLRK